MPHAHRAVQARMDVLFSIDPPQADHGWRPAFGLGRLDLDVNNPSAVNRVCKDGLKRKDIYANLRGIRQLSVPG